MAQYSFRLRRVLSLSSSLLYQQQFQCLRPVSPFTSISSSMLSSKQNVQNPSFSFNSELQFFKSFRSSALSFRNQRSGPVDDQEIGPDTILFEGCDYNHWLITMDLPKEYSPEQKVEAYVRAATQVFGRSFSFFPYLQPKSAQFIFFFFTQLNFLWKKDIYTQFLVHIAFFYVVICGGMTTVVMLNDYCCSLFSFKLVFFFSSLFGA